MMQLLEYFNISQSKFYLLLASFLDCLSGSNATDVDGYAKMLVLVVMNKFKNKYKLE